MCREEGASREGVREGHGTRLVGDLRVALDGETFHSEWLAAIAERYFGSGLLESEADKEWNIKQNRKEDSSNHKRVLRFCQHLW